MSLAGGEEHQVLPAIGGFFVAAKGVYFLTPMSTGAQFSTRFLDAAKGKLGTIATISGKSGGDLSVSPDGRSILYGQQDSAGTDLMLGENFC